MNYPVFVQGVQALQDEVGKPANQRQAEALKLFLLNELLEVHDQQLYCHADVAVEGEVL